jgi:peptide subunit release factor 1 (eRF1)
MAQDLRQAIASVSDHPGPLFSAYVSVNAAIPENQERAYLVRLRDAMNDEGVPERLQEQVREFVEAETHPGARTLAIFAAEDGLFEVYRLQVDLPESFRWGDPYAAPLMLVMDEYEPYGAVVLDAERFRYFVVSPLASPEEAEEVKANGFREVDIHPNQPYPRGGGSTDMDPAGRKQDSNIHRFYKELGELTRDLTFREGVRRLILAGPKERTAEFRGVLPNELKDRVVAEEHVDLGAPEGELRWCDNDQLAIRDMAAEECPFCGQKTRVRPLTDVLVDLAAARGARLDFMLGENENTDVLRDEFGGIAGLTRF